MKRALRACRRGARRGQVSKLPPRELVLSNQQAGSRICILARTAIAKLPIADLGLMIVDLVQCRSSPADAAVSPGCSRFLRKKSCKMAAHSFWRTPEVMSQ